VKRFLLSLGLALAIHGLFLGSEAGWLKKEVGLKHGPRTVTLSLAYHRPEPLPGGKTRQANTPRPKRISRTHDLTGKISPIDKKPVSELIPHSSVLSEQGNPTETKRSDLPEAVFSYSPWVKVDIPSYQGDLEIKEVPALRSFPQATRLARPVYRKNPRPEYPSLARKRGYQGTVLLEILVDRGGKAKDLRVFTSSGYPILDKAALRSVKGWLFEPGVRGSKSVEMWVRIPIRFHLK